MEHLRPFNPPIHLRHPFIQTVLASLLKQKKPNHPMDRGARPVVLDAGKGVKLIGHYSKAPENKALLILIHGWEGSIDSNYIQRTGRKFFERGISIFRLNLRDHGETHHLNPEPFNGSLIRETYEAVRKAAREYGKKIPVYIAGFSLGGNFTLRIAREHSKGKHPVPNLKHCIAVSPALHPKSATEMMDSKLIIGKYFRDKWRASLAKKNVHFPELHPYPEIMQGKSVMEMTDRIISSTHQFKTTDDYFLSYTLGSKDFKGLKVAVTIVTSEDDPIIRPNEFRELPSNSRLKILIQKYGGHNGFYENLKGDCWYFKVLETIFHQKTTLKQV
ncbi:alpha/beta hydrolase family protein [Leptospira inadai serovar Lyme str. 10]|uniref:Alpha/beta hydrolase family protein n=2 Tax=Leptospira inadai serovar Lyme TaxID=293084 RepID=V6HJA6_9LEPT|nr:alpha/beta fold hydrolase [Leptospira inadai]EQA36915.1 alpha/beta hydrolase family protein [Leptospira inadai serovar Lyme str. 10]PNV74546.1 hydrolase [Leptospira inadai serovar Lyme]